MYRQRNRKRPLAITEAKLIEAQIYKIRAIVQKGNKVGLSFYLKNGFEIIDSTPDDEFVMAKNLME